MLKQPDPESAGVWGPLSKYPTSAVTQTGESFKAQVNYWMSGTLLNKCQNYMQIKGVRNKVIRQNISP